MISRGSSSASSQTRQAKFSSCAQLTHQLPSHNRGINPETAHQQALSAASLAFERASEKVITSQNTKENRPGQALRTALIVDSGQRLERKQSIRFTGPTAVPLQNRSITRRVAPCSSFDYSCPGGCQNTLQGKTDCVSRHSENYMRASPQKEKAFTETFVSSLPTSYRRLRKARSMFTSRDSRTATFANVTQQSKSQARAQPLGSHSDDGHRSGMPNSRLHRSFSFLRGEIDDLTSSSNNNASQDAAVKFARDQYFHQLNQQRLNEKPCISGSGNKRKAQKAFRKTVRTGITNSFGPSIGSSGIPSAERSIKNGFGHKARNLSLSLKNKLKRVFHRPSNTEDILPVQQLDASRAHFGGCMSTNSGADQTSHYNPSLDSEVLRKANSLESLLENTPYFFDKNASVGSICSVQSDDENNNGKSRVTSWTDSTAADTMTSSQLIEKKRLSIIQEHGGPHQPSATIRTFADLSDIFQKPVGNKSMGTRHGVSVDSQRVYSALQRRIVDNQRLALLNDKSSSTETKAQNEGAPMPEHQQRSDVAANTSMRGFMRQQGTRYSRLTIFKPLITNTVDDALQDFTLDFSHGKNQQEHFEMPTKLTPQQIAEHNECNNLTPKRPLREVKSAFFPSSMRIERRSTSPYRRIMDSSSEVEPSLKADVESFLKPETGFTLTDQSSHNHMRSGSAIGSASCYSRTSSGNTPKRNKSSLSLTMSDSSGEPGTAVIITTRPRRRNRSFGPFVERRTSSDQPDSDWQEWIASETAHLENHGAENIKMCDAGHVKQNQHRREGAQADEKAISGFRANNLKPRPVKIVQGKATSQPIIKHQISRSISRRYPLAEIREAAMLKNIETNTQTSRINLDTRPRWSPCTVDEKSPFEAERDLPGILRPQASYGSFQLQRNSSLKGQKNYIDFEKSPRDPGATASPVKLQGIVQAKHIEDEHNVPERMARVHRVLSNNSLATLGRTELDKKFMDSYCGGENQDFIDPTIPFANAKEEKNCPTVESTQLRADCTMMDLVLSNRRENSRISEESGTDPAFL